MIKLIIFDLDGVLVDARQLHFDSLNMALCTVDEKYSIPVEEHLSTYDGLPTKTKLNILSETKGLPKELHESIWKLKQEKTLAIVNQFVPDQRLRDILHQLKSHGYQIACATNSVRQTSKLQLIRKGLFDYIDFLYSNEDVKNPKPHSEMYLRCMLRASVNPNETLIVEDSHIGRKAAMASGAHLCAVEKSSDVTLHRIISSISHANQKECMKPKWHGPNITIVIPMAGAGSRFEAAGYSFPKPLIDIGGKPMIQVVVENLNIDAKYVFIVQESHYQQYHLKYLLSLITNNNYEIVLVNGITEGAACTTLLAKHLIDNDNPLIIANSDQFVEWDSNEFMWSMSEPEIDCGIATFRSTHPKWSFVKLNTQGFVVEVAEKKCISDIATAGIYYWRQGSDYAKYAEQMIQKNIRTNNEFYVCPVFNEAIADHKKIKIYNVPKMWGLGTPEDLKKFLTGYQGVL